MKFFLTVDFSSLFYLVPTTYRSDGPLVNCIPSDQLFSARQTSILETFPTVHRWHISGMKCIIVFVSLGHFLFISDLKINLIIIYIKFVSFEKS